MKLMAIFSQEEKELEDPEGCRGRSLNGDLAVLEHCCHQKDGYEAVE